MKATLTLTFEDGSHRQIVLEKAVELDMSGLFQEISFRRSNKGWIMCFTKSLMDGKKLAKDFLSVSKTNE